MAGSKGVWGGVVSTLGKINSQNLRNQSEILEKKVLFRFFLNIDFFVVGKLFVTTPHKIFIAPALTIFIILSLSHHKINSYTVLKIIKN